MTEDTTPAPDTTPEPADDWQGTATYCPEDNKLRLYVGRVPRPDYDRLRAAGWVATPKQACDFAVVWTPSRERMALEFAPIIEDEDQGPEERAADRAERFGEYREKRAGEAGGHADAYEGQSSAHGFQSPARADRAARRHDRTGTRAVSAWSKAEYWQRRTEGVISHALYVSTPEVRMGRIKTLDADLRKVQANLADYQKTWNDWQSFAQIADPEEQTRQVREWLHRENDYPNNYQHPTHPEAMSEHRRQNGTYLSELIDHETHPISGAQACALWLSKHGEPLTEDCSQWAVHLKLRLSYENQMLEAQGGRAAHVEMIPGGWIRGGRRFSEEERQIHKVNKSNVTGRVVSVTVLAPTRGYYDRKGNKYGEDNPRPMTLHHIETERMPADAYRAPTPEELAAFHAAKAKRKAEAPKAPPCPLINPTDEDAERLQAILNERERAEYEAKNHFGSPEARAKYSEAFEPAQVVRITQATYTANSSGSYARAETRGLCAGGYLTRGNSNLWTKEGSDYDAKIGRPLCNVRRTSGGKGRNGWSMDAVIQITDKPKKAFPPRVSNPEAQEEPEPAPAPAKAAATTTEAPATPAPATDFRLWGKHPDHGGTWSLLLDAYTLRGALDYRRQGWETKAVERGKQPEEEPTDVMQTAAQEPERAADVVQSAIQPELFALA